MPVKPEFLAVFDKLRAILKMFAPRLAVQTDEPGHYYLNTGAIGKNKHPVFFGAARIGKNYVSYHLMPVYCSSELVEAMSPELQARMQGKACFNFKRADEGLFKELALLTSKGFDLFKKAGFIPA